MIDIKEALKRKVSKYKVVTLAGKAGAGKDTIFQEILKLNPNLNEIISCTTRPKRENEIDGKNYHFLTNIEFTKKILNNEMLEATVFNDWFYGTPLSSLNLNKINIGVFNPTGIEALSTNPNIELTSILINTSDKNRLLRQLNREENPNVDEIIRRYNTDKHDFIECFFDYEFVNNTLEDKRVAILEISRIIADLDRID